MAHVRYNLDTCSMLVELSTSVWTARKLDKSSTDELVHNKKAQAKDAARVNKHLLAGRKELDIINKHVGAFRQNYYYPRTLPWSDAGLRLLPTTLFMDFNARVVEEQDKFYQLVDDFIAVYPTLITAQAMALGDMFRRDDFPSVETLKNKFSFSINYMPVPTSGDFRVDVGNDAAAELRAQFDRMAMQRVDVAMKDVRDRMREHLTRMSDRLAVDVVGGEVKTRTFHDSLLDTGWELCELVKSLNLVQDSDLENARQQLKATLSGVTLADLRKNMDVRKDVKQEVDAILQKFAW